MESVLCAALCPRAFWVISDLFGLGAVMRTFASVPSLQQEEHHGNSVRILAAQSECPRAPSQAITELSITHTHTSALNSSRNHQIFIYMLHDEIFFIYMDLWQIYIALIPESSATVFFNIPWKCYMNMINIQCNGLPLDPFPVL